MGETDSIVPTIQTAHSFKGQLMSNNPAREMNFLDASAEEIAVVREESTIPEGYLLDYISGTKILKETPKELVRQRIARALFYEYGIEVEDVEIDYPVQINGRKKNLDLAIFEHSKEHSINNLIRVVVCRPEPKAGRGTTRIRDYDQAEKDLDELKEIMNSIESCRYGLWTNYLDFFYLQKLPYGSAYRFEPMGDWPPARGTTDADVALRSHTRRADSRMLRIAFRRCHNFIHGNEGMPKDAAFRQLLYLIFCKMHDEQVVARGGMRRFWVNPKEQFSEEGRRDIRRRIMPLFDEVKKSFPNLFSGREEIILSDRALAFMVSELAKYDFTHSEVDAKGAAYQEIVGSNLRGDRGQYFTPRGVIKLAVEILNPKEDERVFDPACGTGGFLVETLAYMLNKFRIEAKVFPGAESLEEFNSINERLRNYAQSQIYGADFDQFLVKATQMNMVMAGDGKGHLYHMNSLEFPRGHLPDVKRAEVDIPFGSIDVIMTNPPFGSEIPVTDDHILEQYELSYNWEKVDDGKFVKSKPQSIASPELLFIERCLQWLRPGGRAGIVLPNGILGNPANEPIRAWILRNAWVLASVELPVEVFIVEANVNILTSLLFLKKKTAEEIDVEDQGAQTDYPIFMAKAERVGYDRRGNILYKRSPDGADIVQVKEIVENIRVGGKPQERRLFRRDKIVDDDLPLIADKYREFRREFPEPGP
jgi:type I restriction enzyme M protein